MAAIKHFNTNQLKPFQAIYCDASGELFLISVGQDKSGKWAAFMGDLRGSGHGSSGFGTDFKYVSAKEAFAVGLRNIAQGFQQEEIK